VSTGIVFHEAARAHETRPGHPEQPERIDAVRSHLEAAGLWERLDEHRPEPASRELLRLAHDEELVDLLYALDAQGGGRIDLDTSMGPHSLDAALRAAQGTMDAAHRVLDGEWSGAFVCMRPPGHHATPRRPMGFCLVNHVAVATRWALSHGGAERVLIVDWDAHHGNGTQEIFWTDDRVLYISLHQYPWYPGTGDAAETGDGAGAGFTLNVPLPAGTAEDAYVRAFDEIVEPAAAAFGPDLVFVSAGFDGHRSDPLCMMRLTAGAFFRLGRRVAGFGRGPVCVLEGGYDPSALGWSAAATVSALLGSDQPIGVPSDEISPLRSELEAGRWIDRAVALTAPSVASLGAPRSA
jgi:acetoin utilization deacetylase AcuC-like enzyme